MDGQVALFSGPGKPFELRGYELPDSEPGGLLVRILLSNVCGSDLHMWRGELDLERLGLPMPAVLGHEAVGEVVALGPGVTADSAGEALHPGDRVAWRYFTSCGHCPACLRGMTRACQQVHRFISQWQSGEDSPHFVGTFATHHAIRPGQAVFKVPDGLSDSAVAGANCALAEVIQGLRVVGLRVGEAVVVQGAGGLGLFACAVARAMGAGTVVAVDGVAERLDLARAFGASATVDFSECESSRDRVKAVRALTGGGGDVVCEFVGHASAVAEGIQMLAPGGRYIESGCIHTGTSFDFDPAYLTLMNRSLHGVVYYEPWALREALAFLDRERDRFPWERLLAARYPLEEIDRAFADADARRVPRAAIQPVMPARGA
jgi:threonine dehydrogenase-like Zn-dependent dehydrogenase